MNVNGETDKNEFDRTMNAVIIYNDFAGATKAKVALERASHAAEAGLQWSVKLWRLDLLPLTSDAALADAAGAHLLILVPRYPVAHAGWLQDWLKRWATTRQIPDAMLVLWDGENVDELSAASAPELGQFAERHGLSFISEMKQNGIPDDTATDLVAADFEQKARDEELESLRNWEENLKLRG